MFGKRRSDNGRSPVRLAYPAPALSRLLPALFMVLWVLSSSHWGVSTAEASSGRVEIRGSVQDENGAPIIGAEVSLHPVLSRYEGADLLWGGQLGAAAVTEATVSESGAFRLRAPETGMWLVRAKAPGFVAMRLFLVPLLEDVDLEPAVLPRDVGADLQILDSGARPVADAAVLIFRRVPTSRPPKTGGLDYPVPIWVPDSAYGFTDAAGFLRVSVADQEKVQFQVAAEGFPTLTGEATRRNRRLSEEIWRFELPVPKVGTLRVIDERGRPVPDVFVFADRGALPVTLTNDEGRAPLLLPRGVPTLTALSAADGAWGVFTLTADAEEEDDGELELVLREPTVVKARVLDRWTRRPVAGAVVWPSRLVGSWTHSDRRGEVELIMGRGERSLVAGAPGYRPSYQEARMMTPVSGPNANRADESGVLELILQPVADVSGTVLDAEGNPVSGVALTPMPDRETRGEPQTVTAENGSFSLSRLYAGTAYRVLLEPPSESDRSESNRSKSNRSESDRSEFEAGPSMAATWIEMPALEPGEERDGVLWQLTAARSGQVCVVDEQGAPVSAATVTLVRDAGLGNDTAKNFSGPPDRFIDVTGPEGCLVFADVPPERYDMKVDAVDYVAMRVPGIRLPEEEVSVSGPWDLGTVVLADGHEVRGKVQDPSGRGIEGAFVQVRHKSRFGMFGGELKKLTADSDGRFVIGGLAAGQEIAISASAEGFRAKRSMTVRVPEDDLKVILDPAANLSGRVTNPLGWPVEGAVVMFVAEQAGSGYRSESANTDEDGAFQLFGLAPGPGRLEVRAAGYLRHHSTLEIPHPGAPSPAVNVELEAGATLSGRVRTDRGEGVVQAWVTAHGSNSASSQSGQTDADGRFTLTGLELGTLNVAVHKEPFVVKHQSYELTEETGFIDIELETGSTVAGWVTDPDGVPISSATVVLIHGQGQATPAPAMTDAEGRFRIGHVKHGVYTLRAYKDSMSTEVELSLPGAAENLELVLEPVYEEVLTGRIIGLSAAEIGLVEVVARGKIYRRGRVSHDGSFEIPGVSPGKWRVSAFNLSDRNTVAVEVEWPEGSPVPEVELEFVSGFELQGYVAVQGDVAMPTVVSLRSLADGKQRQVSVLGDGSFLFRNVPPGDYGAAFGGAGVQFWRALRLEGDRKWNVTFQGTGISGAVLTLGPDGSQLVGLGDVGVILRRLDLTDSEISTPFGYPPQAMSTRPDGTFNFRGVELGRWELMVQRDGFETRKVSVDVTPSPAPLEIVVGPGNGESPDP